LSAHHRPLRAALQKDLKQALQVVKIGFILDDSLDSSDGVQQYILTLGKWFGQQGHDVHYLVGQTKRQDVATVHSLSRNVAVRFNGNRMSIPLPANRRDIKRLLAEQQFDVLHVQMPYSPFMAARIILAAPPQAVIVGTFHIMPFGRLHTVGAKALQLVLRRSAARLNQVWSVSAPAQRFAASLGIKSQVLPNAIDLSQFKPKNARSAVRPLKQVVFLGRLVQRKGCMQLLKAIDILAQSESIDNLQVKIGGRGPQLTMLRQFVFQHGLSDIIEFVGYVAEADKAAFLAAADVAVFPSLGGESFGIVLLEAMAAGSGVVLAGHNAGYSSVLVSIPQSLFDPTNPAALAALITQMHHQPQLAQRLHDQQQSLVQGFDINLIGQKLLLCYQQQMQQSKQGENHEDIQRQK
ncbi:MAG: glycosyltransferase family 4 protein, partial [Candidatus Saccharimonadales bacterium]